MTNVLPKASLLISFLKVLIFLPKSNGVPAPKWSTPWQALYRNPRVAPHPSRSTARQRYRVKPLVFMKTSHSVISDEITRAIVHNFYAVQTKHRKCDAFGPLRAVISVPNSDFVQSRDTRPHDLHSGTLGDCSNLCGLTHGAGRARGSAMQSVKDLSLVRAARATAGNLIAVLEVFVKNA